MTAAALDVESLREPQRWFPRTTEIPAATAPAPWPRAERPLSVRVFGAGRTMDLDEFLDITYTTALLVIVDGTLVHERYFHGVTPEDRLLGNSATKSALALLVGGIPGLDLDAPARSYVPELDDKACGYRDVTIRHLLAMTTGVHWAEDHRDPDSPAARLVAPVREGTGSLREQLVRIPPGRTPGTSFTYCTADSLVLDWVRERATGRDFTTDLARLWNAVGAEHPAVVGHDPHGVAMAGGSLAATARDWARLGWLQIDGRWHGNPLVPAGWADESSRPGELFLRPGRLPTTITTHAGFGHHWWPLDTAGRRVTADGMRGQFVYADRDRRVVVVKTSAWPHGDAWADMQYRDLCYLALPAVAQAAAAMRQTDQGE
ncbi:serine hydrolase [Streptomyces sp. VRA16 Mangrove soil]|uniref:serine hydrolase domain-containing protein n=1 Tax=Streptomyces sp. VRA16 Mangrove soil TaxID=2817434 RepID=UPI001A9CD464|nr:serine hydrolase [Streptomyces sp. VRA16 Mangrove soil]MBO1332406.1 serine hydrolase [Streptomyces sp. VRA16 Mangrove soil]